MKNKLLIFFIITFTIIFVGAEALFLWLMPSAFYTIINSHKLYDTIKQETKLSLTTQNIAIKTHPDFSITLTADKIALTDENNINCLCIKKLNTKFSLTTLLFNTLDFNNITADEARINITRNKNKKLYLGKYAIPQTLYANKINIKSLNLKIQKANIQFSDNIHKQITCWLANDTQLSYKKNAYIRLKTESSLKTNNKNSAQFNSDFNINLKNKSVDTGKNFTISIINLDLNDFKSYITEITKWDITNISGIINAHLSSNSENDIQCLSSINNLKILMKNDLDSIRSQNDINLDIQFNANEKQLNIKSGRIYSNNWEITTNGTIKNYSTTQIQPELETEIKNANFNELYNLLPSIKEDEFEVIQKLKKHGFWGKLNGKISIKGSFNKPEIYGNITASDVYIAKNQPNVPHFEVFTNFSKDTVEIKTKIYTSKNEYVDISGKSEIKPYAKGNFLIKSSANVDLETALYMLIPIQEIVKFDLGPVPYMKLKGTGNIELKTEGTILDGSAYGQFNFNNTTAILEGLNLSLEKAKGTIDFNGRNLHFYTKESYIKKQLIKIDGKANLDGNIDFDVTTDKIDVKNLFEILNTSHILENKKQMGKPIKEIYGPTKAKIKIKGIVKDYGKILKQNDLDIEGSLNLNNCTATTIYSPIAIHYLNGLIKFRDTDWSTNLKGLIASEHVTINGNSDKFGTNVKISSDGIYLNSLLSKLHTKTNLNNFPDLNSSVSFVAEHKSKDKNINIKNFKATGKITPINPQSNNKIEGNFELVNQTLMLKNIKAKINNSQININTKISEIFDKTRKINGNIIINNFDLTELNKLKRVEILPLQLKNILQTYENYSGNTNIKLTCTNNSLFGEIELNNIKFNHAYFKTPIAIDSGKIKIKNSLISLNSLIVQIDNTPLYLNLAIWDFDKNAKLNGYFTTKLNEQFVNKYINNMLSHPIKIKGDITLTTDIKGHLNNLTIQPKLKLEKNSDIFYMGGNLGNDDEQRELNATIDIFENNKYHIKKFNYTRFMQAQNGQNYPLTILSANGIIKSTNKIWQFDNFFVETQNKLNAKILNIIFQKSIIKDGQLKCKLSLKGQVKSPEIIGYVDIENLKMPLYNALIKKLSLKFKKDIIELSSHGSALNSDYLVDAKIKNNLNEKIIVETVDIKSKNLNLDALIDYITQIPTPNTSTRLINTQLDNEKQFNLNNIIINKGTLKTKEILIKDLIASNLEAEFNLNNNLTLQIPKIEFDITTGKISGTASYEFATEKLKTQLLAFNVDSNKIATSIFGFKDQILGTANGSISMITKGNSPEERIKNMAGFVYFEIANGKMPKLGSIEYLLKAGNFIKSGITGLSINNIIDILSPVKTGEFETIKGSITLKNGVAQNIELFSKSEELNLFINGEYDILEQYANMKVFGRLTQKDNTILDKFGNLSFNSIISQIPKLKINSTEKERLIKELNKIPGVELSNKKYRNFTVKIDGNINDEKYVKNFRWIE